MKVGVSAQYFSRANGGVSEAVRLSVAALHHSGLPSGQPDIALFTADDAFLGADAWPRRHCGHGFFGNILSDHGEIAVVNGQDVRAIMPVGALLLSVVFKACQNHAAICY